MNHIIVCLSSLKSFLKLLVISNSGELLGMDYEKKTKNIFLMSFLLYSLYFFPAHFIR